MKLDIEDNEAERARALEVLNLLLNKPAGSSIRITIDFLGDHPIPSKRVKLKFDPVLLYQWRHKRRLTQEELAAKIEVSRVWITQIESGKKMLSTKDFLELAYALDLEPTDLCSPATT